MRKIELIVIHCSATRENQSYPVTSLISDHDSRFGFTGYHYYIERDGQVYQTRHENLPGAHARHYNQHSIGICYEGGLDAQGRPKDTRTTAQKAALHALLKSLRIDYPEAVILGHRDLPNVHKAAIKRGQSDARIDSAEREQARPKVKDCPCFDAQEEYKDI
jgi:N-acetyl-anhydromuramyl-L-alanine amidase AmpD